MVAGQNEADPPVIESTGRGPTPGTPGEGPEAEGPAVDAEARGRRLRVVGVGASAGGLEALTEFFQAMTAGSGLAFVVVTHLDPEHKSALGDILSRVTALPVCEAEDGMSVVADHVYVLPSNHGVTLEGLVLNLTRRAEVHEPHRPIDTFLVSLAGSRGECAVGVILSGTGTDGTLGLKAIKEAGGVTFAQDETAAHGGMPRSAIATGVVDAILPPARIAAELLEIAAVSAVSGVPGTPTPKDSDSNEDHVFLEILRLLGHASGVDFVRYRQSTLLRRIERRMVLRRLTSLSDYLRCLRADASERRRLFEEVLIPVTRFFRDPESFEALKTSVLPRLLAARPPNTPLRVWVPGCSTGEEAYSLAICLLEYLDQQADAVPLKIFATDISERAIEAARAGAYGEAIVGEVSSPRLRRFFLKTERGYEISKAVRGRCVFARQDVTSDPPFSQLDLISCRNVLIYLKPELQERVLSLFHYALRPSGLLMLGCSEGVNGLGGLFEAREKTQGFFARTTAPSRLAIDALPGSRARRAVIHFGGTDRARLASDVCRSADRVVLARYAPSGVVVDENLRVIQFRGDTGPYLKPPPGPPTTELLQMARDGLLAELREVLDRARVEHASVRKEGVRVKSNGRLQELNLEVIPMIDPVSAAQHFVVLFEAVRHVSGPDGLVPWRGEPPAAEELPKEAEIHRLSHELAMAKQYLQSLIEQKDATNEELQSTNEELTTAQEEVQATNEELSTVNDELQNRIRDATLLSDDLFNLIDSTRIPMVVLGTDLCIRRFTPSAQEVMNLRPGDLGRPLREIKPKVHVPDLEQLVHEVIETRGIKQLEVVGETGTWHKLYLRPYTTLDRKVGGVVLTFIDIDTLKRREQEVKESRDYTLSILDTVREPLLVLTGDLWVRLANRAFYQGFQLSSADTEGRLIDELGHGEWKIPRLRTLLEAVLPEGRHFENFEVVQRFPPGEERTLLLNAHRVVQGEGAREPLILLAIEDITDRRRAERLRQESEDRLRKMVDNAVDAIVTIDEHGTIHSINAETERMFGYAATELIGHNVKILMPVPYRDQHDDYLAHYLRTGEKRIIGIGREVLGCRKDGTTFPLDLAVSEFEDRGKLMFSGVLRDLSARKALEQEVLEAATLEQRRIGQELHDTSAQELTALGLLAESLVTILKEQSPAAAGIAAKMTEGLKRVIGQVRAYSRGLIRVELDEQGLTAALAELAAETRELHEVACTFECQRPVEVTDNQTALQLYGITREAVTNALKHAQARNIKILLESDDRSVTLRVEDDGIGIPVAPVNLNGMGLRIMRYRAGLINAHLSVESGEPAGASVTCTWKKDVQHADAKTRGK